MMERREFIIDVVKISALLGLDHLGLDFGDPIFGHNQKRFIWDKAWAKPGDSTLFIKDCHEMVFTPSKDILLLTNDTRNNLILFDKKGKIKNTEAGIFPGGHGLTMAGEGSDAILFVTDTELHQFYMTTMAGKVIKTWDCPLDTGKYTSNDQFVPTETAITKDGEIYVADGYGAQFITHYGADGHIKNIFGGRGAEDHHLDNAHGICIDHRGDEPKLVISDRTRCCFKIFTMGGEYLRKIELPGARVCRPVIMGEYLYAAVLNTNGADNTGFVVILDSDYKLISVIGGSEPAYDGDKARASYQTVKLFKHPHDVLVDEDGALYVCQWNSDHVLPYKFTPHV
jgi:hypothetical protein